MSAKLCDIDCTLVHQTDLALLVKSHETDRQAWVPKAVAEFVAFDRYDPSCTRPIAGVLTLPESWAIDKSLV